MIEQIEGDRQEKRENKSTNISIFQHPIDKIKTFQISQDISGQRQRLGKLYDRLLCESVVSWAMFNNEGEQDELCPSKMQSSSQSRTHFPCGKSPELQ